MEISQGKQFVIAFGYQDGILEDNLANKIKEAIELRQEIIELGESVIRYLKTFHLEDVNYLDFPEESIALELIQLNSELLKIQHGMFKWLTFLHETFAKSMGKALKYILFE